MKFLRLVFFLILLLTDLISGQTSSSSLQANVVEGFFRKSGHTNNWAVLVNSSRFWFNYRHGANVLSIYRTVKRLGIPDNQILFLNADDFACNPRNPYPGQVFNDVNHRLNLYGDHIEVDYRGYEVTVENFIRLITDRVDPSVPKSKRLLSDDRSNILVYMTGHGGDEFLKFQDSEELSSFDLADAFEQMWQKRRYHEILFMIDTCQANTMFSRFYSPNIIGIGSSQKGENSFSYDLDARVGVSLIDRFTYENLEIMEKVDQKSQKTIKDMFQNYRPAFMRSNPGIRMDLSTRPVDKMLITDFFGSVQSVELTMESYPLKQANQSSPPSSFDVHHSRNSEQQSKVAKTTERTIIGGLKIEQPREIPIEFSFGVTFLLIVAAILSFL